MGDGQNGLGEKLEVVCLFSCGSVVVPSLTGEVITFVHLAFTDPIHALVDPALSECDDPTATTRIGDDSLFYQGSDSTSSLPTEEKNCEDHVCVAHVRRHGSPRSQGSYIRMCLPRCDARGLLLVVARRDHLCMAQRPSSSHIRTCPYHRKIPGFGRARLQCLRQPANRLSLAHTAHLLQDMVRIPSDQYPNSIVINGIRIDPSDICFVSKELFHFIRLGPVLHTSIIVPRCQCVAGYTQYGTLGDMFCPQTQHRYHLLWDYDYGNSFSHVLHDFLETCRTTGRMVL